MNTKKARDKNTLEANISRTGNYISVKWIARGEKLKDWEDYEDYLIPIRAVISCSKDLREILAGLEGCDWTEQGDSLRLSKLRELAARGTELYHLLLTGTAEKESSQRIARKFRKWFENTVAPDQENWRIQIVHHQYDTLVIPWGLVFTPLADDGDTEKLSLDFDDYNNFWAHSFRLAVRGTLGLESEKK